MKAIENEDITLLLRVENRPQAEEIQRVLEQSGVYSLLQSDNPASSAMMMYVGNEVFETISVYVASDSYLEAVRLLEDTPYFELLVSDEEDDEEVTE